MYLTSDSLFDVLKEAFKTADIVRELKLGRYRFDYFLPGHKILVEFDGFFHYTDSNCIRRDLSKNELAVSNGYKLVRWPYWIQPTPMTLKHFFEIKSDIHSEYPQGFIDKNVILPADFCELGIGRFLKEYRMLSVGIQDEIRCSLVNKINEKERKRISFEFVVPEVIRQALFIPPTS